MVIPSHSVRSVCNPAATIIMMIPSHGVMPVCNPAATIIMVIPSHSVMSVCISASHYYGDQQLCVIVCAINMLMTTQWRNVCTVSMRLTTSHGVMSACYSPLHPMA